MTLKKRSPSASLVRSSAAEHLTFVAASGGGGVEAVYADENVWLPPPDQHTAGIGFQVVIAAAEDLVRAEARLGGSQEVSG